MLGSKFLPQFCLKGSMGRMCCVPSSSSQFGYPVHWIFHEDIEGKWSSIFSLGGVELCNPPFPIPMLGIVLMTNDSRWNYVDYLGNHNSWNGRTQYIDGHICIQIWTGVHWPKHCRLAMIGQMKRSHHRSGPHGIQSLGLVLETGGSHDSLPSLPKKIAPFPS